MQPRVPPTIDPEACRPVSPIATMGGSEMPNGLNTNGYGHNYDYPPSHIDGPYRILDQYHSKPAKLRVACVGAGASGLCLAYKMEKMLEHGSWELTLYEKNAQFGGTWYENTYPGVACDIPSHDYNFTWDPKPDWSTFFASGKEIQGYFEDFAERHGSKKYMQLNSRIEQANWNDEDGCYSLTIRNPKTGSMRKDWAHVLVNGSGILNNWKWPNIEGLHDFKGPVLHSACWDHSVDFTNKTAAVIGVGSTSVQIVPSLQKIVKGLEVYMRSPTWISPPFGAGALNDDLQKGQDVDPGQRQYTFTEADIKKFKEDPEYHLEFRKKIEAEINSLFGMYQQNSELQNQFKDVITKEMHRRMGPGHEKLKEFIIPKWSVGCRRISPGDGFLEALVQDNVTPVFDGIERVVPEGIKTRDGKIHKLDAIVCATGFQVAFQPAFTVRNGSNVSIKEDWTNGPNLYMGVSAPRFPNFYTIVGPGATWSNGTLIPSIETTVEYSIKCMKKMQTEGIKAMSVKQDALDEIYAHFDEFHKTTVWQEECRSWFKNGQIKNRIYLWPGATIHFLKSIKTPRWEDYDYVYRYKNRFAFLGNGDVKATKMRDMHGLSPYIRNYDHEWDVD